MRLFSFLSFAVAALAALQPGKAAAEEVRLAPSSDSRWVVDYGEEKCRLARAFGEGEKRHLLFLDQFAPGDSVALTVAGPEIRRFAQGREISLRFGPTSSAPEPFTPTGAQLESYGPAIFIPSLKIADELNPDHEQEPPGAASRFDVDGLPGFDAEITGSIEWLEISRRGNSVVLELPQFAKALDALGACAQNLVTHWGLDLESHQSMTRLAEPINIDEIARRIQGYYPPAALQRGKQAAVSLRIIVDADGSIEKCAISDVSSTRLIESPACDVFGDRAMFAPAEDAAGDPMKSYYTAKIIYTLGR